MPGSHRTTVTIPSDEMLAAIEKRAKANGLKLGTYFLHLASADCGRHGEWPVPPECEVPAPVVSKGKLALSRRQLADMLNGRPVSAPSPDRGPSRIEIHQPNGDVAKMEATDAEMRHTGHDWQLVATLVMPPGASPWSPDSATTPADPE